MIDIPEDIAAEIRSSLLRSRSPSRTATSTGYSISLVLQISDELKGPRSYYKEKFGGKGRPELQQYTVGRKKAWEEWDNKEPLIDQARKDYENGVVEIVTGRDGEFLILYAIPRRKAQPRVGYFNPVEY